MSKFIAQIKNTDLDFNYGHNKANDARFRDFCRANQDKFVNIELEEPPVFSLVKFFEGPVVQYYFYQHGLVVPLRNFRDAREALKLKFNPIEIIADDGSKKIVAGSLSGKGSKFYNSFLEIIEKYFKEKGYEFPDSKEYNDWIKTAPGASEIFIPVTYLVEAYNKNKKYK